MAVWIPLLRASLPYLTQIVTAALPAFTAKLPNEKTDEVISRQIAELQTAVTNNAGSVKSLAAQLQEALENVDSNAMNLKRELKTTKQIAMAAVVVAVLSLAVSLWVVFVKV